MRTSRIQIDLSLDAGNSRLDRRQRLLLMIHDPDKLQHQDRHVAELADVLRLFLFLFGPMYCAYNWPDVLRILIFNFGPMYCAYNWPDVLRLLLRPDVMRL